MLNKAICEWLLEDEEYKYSVGRLSELNDSSIRQNASILRAIDLHYKKDNKTSKSILKELRETHELAELNYNILFKKCKRKSNTADNLNLPVYELPDFDFRFR